MSDKIQLVAVSYSDYTHVKYVPVMREECLDSINKSLQSITTRYYSRKEQKD